MGAPFILPTLVAVLGLLAVFGRSGWSMTGWRWSGLGPVNIYGLHGVVLAHVFYNLPLATRIILQGWAAIPANGCGWRCRLAFPPRPPAPPGSAHAARGRARRVPAGLPDLPDQLCRGAGLGGGPRATTVELAIYQAFRFDYDMGRAAALALVQFALCLGAGLLALRVALPSGLGGGLDRPLPRMEYRKSAAWGDGALITLAALFLLVPWR